MKKNIGLQLEYKTKFDKDTVYVYWNGLHVRATRLVKDEGGNKWYVPKNLVYADSVPMLTWEELKERYTVRMQFYYGNNKKYSIATGKLNFCLLDTEDSKMGDQFGIFWTYISPSSSQPYFWNYTGDIQFVAKKGAFKKMQNT
jgi:hypothetical protein|tara:strand:+ start:18329 stop:18757 length:429 start_codon:yes stop_codon:yes gene_type:complete